LTAAEVLETASRRGVELFTEGDRLRYRAPPGALTPELREALISRRSELLALLQGLGRSPPPDEWDAGRADAVLAAVNARLDRALSAGGEADTPARRNVAEAYRRVVAGYHADRHPLLWEALEATEALLARWRGAGPKTTTHLAEEHRHVDQP
jgi:hypothetical protein